jgi:hypothetical protein
MEIDYLQFMQNKYKAALIIFYIIFISQEVRAQKSYGYYNDALRLSQTTFGGSARFQGLGGATTALGADIGSLSSNPAGLGFYNRSDMNFSLGLGINHTKSNFMGNSEKEGKSYVNIPSMGMVFSGPKDDTLHKWKGGTFGFGVTCINNFQNRFHYSGLNAKNNFTDFLVQQTNGTSSDSLNHVHIDELKDLPSLAYYSFLVNPVDPLNNTTQYNSFITGDTVKQEETVTSKGRQYQYDIAYAGNINDKLYLGASLGIVTVKYTAAREFKETTSPTDTLINYTFSDNRVLKGAGVNLKLGVIYRVSDWLRIGGSILTPTSYSLKETRTYKVSANFIDLFNTPYSYINQVDSASARPDAFRYHLNTPLKLSGGVALFAGKKGFISGDISYLNYSATGLKSASSKSIEGDKKQVDNFYKSTFNFNVGGEFRRNALRLRAGLGYYGNPYKEGNVNGSVKNISLGAGFRYETHYLDIAFVNTVSKSNYKPYTLNDGTEPSVTVKNNNIRIIATVGLLF